MLEFPARTDSFLISRTNLKSVFRKLFPNRARKEAVRLSRRKLLPYGRGSDRRITLIHALSEYTGPTADLVFVQRFSTGWTRLGTGECARAKARGSANDNRNCSKTMAQRATIA